MTRMRTAEADINLSEPIVLRCRECRFSDRGVLDSEQYARCKCPKQSDWADREATQDWTFVSLVRSWDCHGKWWEARLPDPPRLTWLRRLLRRFSSQGRR